MKGDGDDFLVRNSIRKYRIKGGDSSHGNLLDELLEKEEEVTIYKSRLKELETAFYYNLELISERDFELSVLEKRLTSEHEQLMEVIGERDELEDLLKAVDEKKNKKIQQLEMRLSLNEEKMKDLQRENLTKTNKIKELLDSVKQRHDENMHKMTLKFEIQKNELLKTCREEQEEKEKFYLMELDNLNGKLKQVLKERDDLLQTREENKNLRKHIEDRRKQENHYLEQNRKTNREIQCSIKPQKCEKEIEVKPTLSNSISQTMSDMDEKVKKINFLQEQNEVLKHIVKDLKKNLERVGKRSEEFERRPRCECLELRKEVENINRKFQSEVSNIKKILEEDKEERAEEDAVIESLERSVNSLKERLLVGLQEKLEQVSGENICAYTYNREIQNEIQVSILEEKIEFLATSIDEHRRLIQEKLESFKKEFMEILNQRSSSRNEEILQKIQTDLQKLENKIEMFRCDKCERCGRLFEFPANYRTRPEPFTKSFYPEFESQFFPSREKCINGF